MATMILKMSGMTAIYIILVFILHRFLRGRQLKVWHKVLIGLLFGLCSVLSTHFGVDYNHMMVNVRDIGPLAGGMFFDPVSGIIAGLIGGIERYIAGTYWNIGAYTTIACSVSTALAGFLAAFLHICIFRRKQPSAPYAFFMGAVMEVFHMYAVFITHRDDMNMAFYVVKNCSVPMIVFTGVGLAISAFLINTHSFKLDNFKKRLKVENRTVARRFQAWLFVVTLFMMVFNFLIVFTMQGNTAKQDARITMEAVGEVIRAANKNIEDVDQRIDELLMDLAESDARSLAYDINLMGGIDAVTQDYVDDQKHILQPIAIAILDDNEEVLYKAGSSAVYTGLFDDVFSGAVESQVKMPTDMRACAMARIDGGAIFVAYTKETVNETLNLQLLNKTLSRLSVGDSGSYDIVRQSGYIDIGYHSVTILTGEDREIYKSHKPGELFESAIFGVPALCLIQTLNEQDTIFLRIPLTEIYTNRDRQAYETALANVLLFAVIFVLVSLMVQNIVIDNLEKVNKSLAKITDGNLDEVVSVRSSSEFTALSEDINKTVTALKGYIDEAEHRMEQELELARSIQISALPRTFSFPRTDFEIYAMMNPAKEVGGDFYDFFFIGHNRLALVIADVSGKGIPAALFMMQSKAAIRSLAEGGHSPSEILFKANNVLCKGNDAEMFVTVWIGIIDLETGHMVCANAGHEYPAIMHKGGSFELFKEPHGMVLAALEDMHYKEYEIYLSPGDQLFVYTDGVPEAINEKTEQYGTNLMLNELNLYKDQSVREMLIAVRQDIQAFCGKADQFDDITMLGFRYLHDIDKDDYDYLI